jgi:hypothetical protein
MSFAAKTGGTVGYLAKTARRVELPTELRKSVQAGGVVICMRTYSLQKCSLFLLRAPLALAIERSVITHGRTYI